MIYRSLPVLGYPYTGLYIFAYSSGAFALRVAVFKISIVQWQYKISFQSPCH